LPFPVARTGLNAKRAAVGASTGVGMGRGTQHLDRMALPPGCGHLKATIRSLAGQAHCGEALEAWSVL
jgi:hypothetical protein